MQAFEKVLSDSLIAAQEQVIEGGTKVPMSLHLLNKKDLDTMAQVLYDSLRAEGFEIVRLKI